MRTRPTRTIHIDQAILWPAVTNSPLVWRYTAYALLLGLVFLFQTWSRVDARETALALDHARYESELFLAQHERLLLELASLTSLGSLSEQASALELSADVTLVEVN
ncbi:MAG: hypothetical protein ABIO70_14200 [Pseudomonadota bacterium]